MFALFVGLLLTTTNPMSNSINTGITVEQYTALSQRISALEVRRQKLIVRLDMLSQKQKSYCDEYGVSSAAELQQKSIQATNEAIRVYNEGTKLADSSDASITACESELNALQNEFQL